MNIRFLLFSLCLLLCLVNCCFAQTPQNGSRVDVLQKVIPPSPEAASLGKYGDIPVSLVTGSPNISIPLYTISEGDIHLPVSISYYAGGIRVNEIASRTGLGWTLNAGGAITRVVRGIADETNGIGYLNRDAAVAPLTIPITQPLTDAQYVSLENLAYSRADMEPDFFAFNFGKHTGKFFFDHNKNIHMVSPEDLKIEYTADFSSWTITDQEGTVYTFATSETTTSSTLNMDDIDQVFKSSWFLTKIKSKNGREINFFYDGTLVLQDVAVSESDYYAGVGANIVTNPCYACDVKNNMVHPIYSRQTIGVVKLNRIESLGTIAKFVYSSSQRQDLASDYALDSIIVSSKETGKMIKKYHLTHNYITGNSQFGPANPEPLSQPFLNKRLMLQSIEELPADPAFYSLPLVHTFSYDAGILPPRCSFAQDHWGFYNGADGNLTMLPKTSDLPINIKWGERSANAAYAKGGSLNKITYPTGGNSSFTFEPNSTYGQVVTRADLYKEITMVNQAAGTIVTQSFTLYEIQDCEFIYQAILGNYPQGDINAQVLVLDQNNVTVGGGSGNGSTDVSLHLSPGNYTLKMIYPDIPESNLYTRIYYKGPQVTQNVVQEIGGLRIQQLTDNDPVANKTVVKSFIYPQVPVILDNKSNDDYIFNHSERAAFSCLEPPPPYLQLEYKCNYTGRSSSTRSSLGSLSGQHFGYDSVQVLEGALGENGRTVHYFNLQGPITYGGFPYAPAMDYDARNGLEKRTRVLSASGNVLTETVNTYSFSEKYKELSAKVGFLYDDPYTDAYNSGKYHDVITYAQFYVLSETATLANSVVTQYDPLHANSIQSTTTLYYDNPLYQQPTRTQTVNSKGDTITEYTKYPLDYTVGANNTAEALGIYNLQQKHIINAPIEKYTVKKLISGTSYVTSGAILTYKTNQTVPDKIYTLDITTPLLLSQFTQSSINGSSSFTKDSRYSEKVSFTDYDVYGNLLTQSKTNDVREVYLYGYNKQYPVAKILNSTFAVANGLITQAVLDNPADDASLRLHLNNLRSIPGALVTTYTYSPLIGVTSETDASGKTNFYEYDGFNRLKNIKDYQGNIVKNFRYNYANSCGNNCVVLQMQTFTGYNTPSYPVGVFNGAKQYIGTANTPAQYVTLWNSNAANQAIGVLSTNADSLHFNLSLATNATPPPVVYGLRFYQWVGFSHVNINIASDSLSFIDWGDGNKELLVNGRQINDAYNWYAYAPVKHKMISYLISRNHHYANGLLNTLTVFHNETTEIVNFNTSQTDDSVHLSNIRGYYPEKVKAICYNYMPSSSDTGVINYSKLTEVLQVHYQQYGSYSRHNSWQSINNFHKLRWLKMGYANGGEVMSNLRVNFPNLEYLECQLNKPNITQTWGGAGFPNLYVLAIGLQTGSLSTTEIDLILNSQAPANTETNGLLGFGPVPVRSAASNTAYNSLAARGWALQIASP